MSEPKAGTTADSLAGVEMELKLAGEPETLEAIFASTIVGDRATGRGTSRRLENVYYDTADQRLRARGLAFRVRKDGRRYVQTLKSNDTEGLVTLRGEWQAPLPSAEPDFAAMPMGAAEVLDHLVRPGELERLFTTRVRRRVRRLSALDRDGRPSLVEAALDLGEIETARGREPIAELELELLEGSAAALYDLALQLDALAPLRIETRSKSARGYALATGEPPAWHKAAPLTLQPRATVDEALRTILRACVQHWCANEAAALVGHHPEGVHQMRVALRRLRSAASVFGQLIDPTWRAWLNDHGRRVINALGPARDLDVFLTELLPPLEAARPGDPHLGALRAVATAARARAYETARAAIRAPDYTRFLLQLRRWIEAGGWRADATEAGRAWQERPIAEFAEQLLDRRHRKVRKRGRHFARLSAGDRHRVRIALKKLRYATEFFQSLYGGKRTTPYVTALKSLQDELGHLNDVAVAEPLLAGLIDAADDPAERELLPRAAGMVLGWYGRGLLDVEPAAVAAWHEFVARKPFWH